MNLLLSLILFVLLTIVTQIGGVALIVGWLLLILFGSSDASKCRRRLQFVGAFSLTYIVMTLFIVPPLAALWGRVPLPCSSAENHYAAGNSLFCILNRNYVHVRLRSLLENLARHMNTVHPGTVTLDLDANFPFFDGFPLFPHLSHDDGRKLDIAYYYADATEKYLPGVLRSPIGYWGFEQPARGADAACPGSTWMSLRWDMNWLQPFMADVKLDVERTKEAVNWVAGAGRNFSMEKMFMEPHMAQRLGVSSPFLKFQGCRAARHDDHIHVQIGR